MPPWFSRHTYVKEKLDNTVPWDGGPKYHLQLDSAGTARGTAPGMTMSQVTSSFANAFAIGLPPASPDFWSNNGEGNDINAALHHIRVPIPNVPRLAGYSYPIGNPLYLQTAETLLCYGDYLEVAEQRYGFLRLAELDTAIPIPKNSETVLQQSPPQDWRFQEYAGLWSLLQASFADDLRLGVEPSRKSSFLECHALCARRRATVRRWRVRAAPWRQSAANYGATLCGTVAQSYGASAGRYLRILAHNHRIF